MNFEIVPAADLPLGKQANVFNAAFAGYLVLLGKMDAPGLARFLCAQGADLCYSRFVRADETLAGFGYINRTGNIPRLAGMGTVPDFRRTGAAAYLLSQLLEETKARGDAAMVLEVFEQNAPAVSLYRRYHFTQTSRLFGWRRIASALSAPDQREHFEEMSVIDASRTPSSFEYPEIPWQISRHAMLKLPTARAFGNARACVVIGDATVQPIRVHALCAAERDWKGIRNILAAVIREFPNCEFFAPAIFPEEFGLQIFGPLGFAREPLNQLLMRQEL
jgi:ribosomal protein S18 acetylase RimI-like enzyme